MLEDIAIHKLSVRHGGAYISGVGWLGSFLMEGNAYQDYALGILTSEDVGESYRNVTKRDGQ